MTLRPMPIVYWISRRRFVTRVFLTDDFVELDSILLADEAARRRYLDYCRMHVALRVELRAHRAAQKARQQINIESVAIGSK